MEEKLRRFLELSVEFTIDSDEIYDGFVPEIQCTGHIIFGNSNGPYTITATQSNTTPQPTKLEQFETAQLEKIEKAKRYEEYLTLRTDLLNYYNAKEKLNN